MSVNMSISSVIGCVFCERIKSILCFVQFNNDDVLHLSLLLPFGTPTDVTSLHDIPEHSLYYYLHNFAAFVPQPFGLYVQCIHIFTALSFILLVFTEWKINTFCPVSSTISLEAHFTQSAAHLTSNACR